MKMPRDAFTPIEPITNPIIVTVKAVAPIVAPDVVITTDVVVVAQQVTVSPATLLAPAATPGVTDGAKKPEGYVSVIVPPEGRGVVGVKPSVTGTDDLPATRSDDAMYSLEVLMRQEHGSHY